MFSLRARSGKPHPLHHCQQGALPVEGRAVTLGFLSKASGLATPSLQKSPYYFESASPLKLPMTALTSPKIGPSLGSSSIKGMKVIY